MNGYAAAEKDCSVALALCEGLPQEGHRQGPSGEEGHRQGLSGEEGGSQGG